MTLLDGDIVRKNLSSELGFSKEHRDLNIRRIGYVASEITKNGGIAICAPIAPYATTRRAVREDIEQFGAFIEVHVATSIEECERRDRKGLYKLAREGKIKEFTGISDPYDVPEPPELRVETENVDVDNCAHQVILKARIAWVDRGSITKGREIPVFRLPPNGANQRGTNPSEIGFSPVTKPCQQVASGRAC